MIEPIRPMFAVDVMKWVRYSNKLEKRVAQLEGALLKIKRAAKLYLEHGEPELAAELDTLLTEAKEK